MSTIPDGTYRVCDGELVNAQLASGYIVGKGNGFVLYGRNKINRTSLHAFAQRSGSSLVGVWTDGSKQYIDPVEVFSNLDAALRAAKARGELAVWDAGMNEEVRVP